MFRPMPCNRTDRMSRWVLLIRFPPISWVDKKTAERALPRTVLWDTIINERMVIPVAYEYNARLIPEADGRWTAEIPALPGCGTSIETAI